MTEPNDFCTTCGFDYDAMSPERRAFHGIEGEMIVRPCTPEIHHSWIEACTRVAFAGRVSKIAFDAHNETWIVVDADSDVWVCHVGSDDDHMKFECLTARSARIFVALD